jgi:hypothetical protein
MALITCPECGKEFSDKAASCPNCGCPTEEIVERESSGGNNRISCPRCGGHNILIEKVAKGEKSSGKSEIHKKSIVTRAANKTVRGTMILATGGLWALTPKKSDYKETSKGKSKVKYKKVATCQDCGKDWTVWF